MGFLDCIAGIMQIFAATYLPGSLVILMLQAAIPVSMFLSYFILKARYHLTQYVAALLVCGGILIVLGPSLFGGGSDDDSSSGGSIVLWSVVLIGSCVPMCLSSIYKEIALGETELDPVYLNAWIAVFQFLFSIPLAVPSGYASDPPVDAQELPKNLYDGLQCYVGISNIDCADDDDDDCHTDKCFIYGPLFVNIYLCFNVLYNILIIMILKWGSANILWLAMTVMVPLGNFAFALPFMPESETITAWDVIGLVVILGGLVGYRVGPKIYARYWPEDEDKIVGTGGENPLISDEKSRKEPLLNDDM